MKHEQLVELARLWRMAQEYQEKAARLDSGKLPILAISHPTFERNGYAHEQGTEPSCAGFIRLFISIRNRHQRSFRRSADRVRLDRSSAR